jgi:hypothetical protein
MSCGSGGFYVVWNACLKLVGLTSFDPPYDWTQYATPISVNTPRTIARA